MAYFRFALLAFSIVILGSFTQVFSQAPPPTPPTDSDGDGIYDSSDACVNSAETYNNYQDTDGCPDAPPPLSLIPTPPEELAASLSQPTDEEIRITNNGCLIATATFGSELAPQVQMLREIRDHKILSTTSGAAFMTGFNQFYYSFSPTVADLERQNPVFKELVKVTITPLLSSLSLLQYVDIDSEAEILGYGIGIILLNIGMYFVASTVVIVKVGQLFKNKIR